MFHDLLKYEDEDFYKEHQTIIFDTLDGPGTYIVIAAFYTKAYPEGIQSIIIYMTLQMRDQKRNLMIMSAG